MNDGHLGRELCEEHCFFHSGVAASCHGNVLLPEEEAVTRGAPADSVAGELLLAGHSQLSVRRTRCQNDSTGVEDLTGAGGDLLNLAAQVQSGGVLVPDVGAEASRLGFHVHHEVRSHDALGESGEVLDLSGVHQLPARGDRACEHHRAEIRSGGVDGSRVVCGSGADDHNVVHLVRV